MVDQWLNAFNAGDASALSSLYADDAVGMGPEGPHNFGRDAMREVFVGLFEESSHTETATVEEVEVLGDMAFVWGTWRDLATPIAGGDVEEADGDWLWILRRQPNGRWLIARHISNRTLPQP